MVGAGEKSSVDNIDVGFRFRIGQKVIGVGQVKARSGLLKRQEPVNLMIKQVSAFHFVAEVVERNIRAQRLSGALRMEQALVILPVGRVFMRVNGDVHFAVMLQKIRLILDKVLSARRDEVFQILPHVPQVRFALLTITGHLIEVRKDAATAQNNQQESEDKDTELKA